MTSAAPVRAHLGIFRGALLFDAVETAKGKPGSPLRSLYVGTMAPATSGWWHELVLSKSGQGRAITCLQGRPDRWDQWREIARVNPLVRVSAEFRKQLRSELQAAQADSRLKGAFFIVQTQFAERRRIDDASFRR